MRQLREAALLDWSSRIRSSALYEDVQIPKVTSEPPRQFNLGGIVAIITLTKVEPNVEWPGQAGDRTIVVTASVLADAVFAEIMNFFSDSVVAPALDKYEARYIAGGIFRRLSQQLMAAVGDEDTR